MTEINLPPALAAHRADLIDSIARFEESARHHEDDAAEQRRNADLCLRQIAGIDEAAEAFAEMLGQDAGERIAREEKPAETLPAKIRRERRDILGLVLEAVQRAASTVDELQTMLPDIKRSQIENALAHHEAGGRIRSLRNGRWWFVDDMTRFNAEIQAREAAQLKPIRRIADVGILMIAPAELAGLIDAAVAEERERCGRIAREFAWSGGMSDLMVLMRNRIAEAIERGDKAG